MFPRRKSVLGTTNMPRKHQLHRGFLAAAASLLVLGPASAGAADTNHGAIVFKSCAACHNDRQGALGPDLRGVYGRKAGALEEFRYSNAMKRTEFVWDAANLKAYLADPQAKVKGNRMPFSGLQNPADIDDVVAYLQTFK
jgi:cytochrome c